MAASGRRQARDQPLRRTMSSRTATGKGASAANPAFEFTGPSANGEAGGCCVERFVGRHEIPYSRLRRMTAKPYWSREAEADTYSQP
jgi:hypothetical protein